MTVIHRKPISRIRKVLNRISRVNLINLFHRYKFWIFTPSNKLHLRNIPRSWIDRSERAFHAPFSILCDYVEKDLGGVEKAKKRLGKIDPADAREAAEHEIVDLYVWYNSIDWKWHSTDTEEYTEMNKCRIMTIMENGVIHTMRPGYSPSDVTRIVMENINAERAFEDLCTEQAIRLMKIRKYLWT